MQYFLRKAKLAHLLTGSLLCLLPMASCSLRVGEPEAKPAAISIRSDTQVCLDGVGSTMDRFFAGQATPNEIDVFWGCLDRSVHYFLASTRGADPNSYSPRELANFVEKYFLNGSHVPDSLLTQFMRLKQGLFGGRMDVLTRDEIQKLVRLTTAFPSATKTLAPQMPLGPDQIVARARSERDIAVTMAAVEAAATTLSTAMEEGLGRYSVVDLTNLLSETKRFFQSAGWTADWITSVEKFVPLISSVKAVVIAPPKEEMLPADWVRLFRLAPQYYTIYLRYHLHFRRPKSFFEGEGLYQIVRILDQGIPLVESSLRNRPRPIISTVEIDAILDQADKLKLLTMPKRQLRSLIALTLNRFLPDPSARGRLQISPVNLRELRTLYSYFTDGLRAIDGAFRREFGENTGFVQILSRERARELFNGQRSRDTVFNNEATRVAMRDLRKNVDEVNITFDQHAGFVIVPSDGSIPLSRFHLTRLHYLRTLNKALLRAYGNSRDETISEEQIKTMLSDLEPVFAFFRFDSSSFAGAVSRRLFEASLFLPSSDAETLLTMKKAMEIETLFLSVFDLSPDIHRQIERICNTRRGSVTADCYQRAFAENVSEFWRGAPGMGNAVGAVEIEARTSLVALMDTFLRMGSVGQPYEESDTKSILQMGYYIELLFFRFDSNHDGRIDQTEARAAYPLFRGFIARKATELGRTDPAEHYKIFTYILAHQRVPDSFWEKVGYVLWEENSPYSINRVETLGIFATLLANMGSTQH